MKIIEILRKKKLIYRRLKIKPYENLENIVCSKCSRFLEKCGFESTNCLLLPNFPNFARNGLKEATLTYSSGASFTRVVSTFQTPANCKKCIQMQHSEYILIHPQLWVNWTGADPLPNETDSIQLEISVTVKAPIVEKARIVQVAMIKSMHYSTKSECAKSLAEFFSTPRLVYLDDVFCVNQDRDETEITVEIGIQEENSPKRWFKVADIVKEAAAQDREMLEDSIISKGPFWVHTNHSTLYQMPDSNAFVPQMSIDTSEENLVFGPFGDSIPSFFMELVLKLQQRSIASRRMGSALSVLIHGPAGSGKELIASCLALTLHMNICVVDCYQLWSETPGTAEAKLKNLFDKCMDNSPCLLLLKNIEVLGKDPNTGEPDSRITAFLQSSFERIKQAPLQVIIFGTSTVFREVPIDLLALFGEEIKIKNLTLKDRSSLLSALCNLSESELAVIAERTPGFVAADLISLVEELKNPIASGSNPMEKLSSCLDEMQTDYGDSIGAPKIPDVAWEDVGGLEDAKKAILDTIESGKLNLVNSDLKRSGVLLHGPPGCGKTLLAKAVASQCKLTFLSVKGPELLNMYVGQSEHNVRDVFEKARAASPCIIFFDELDALAPNRGKSGDSGGVMDRVVSQLLAELDGVQENQDLFVIGATNRPDLVDPSLLRPGRFDKSIYVGLNGDRKSQRKVLDALLRKLPIDDAVEPQLDGIISTLPTDVSGADIYSLVAQASAKAIGREIARVQAGEIQEEEGRFKILLNDLEDASMEMFVR